MPKPVPVITQDELIADLAWLEVDPQADWKEKARALNEDMPFKYHVSALCRCFGVPTSTMSRCINPHYWRKARNDWYAKATEAKRQAIRDSKNASHARKMATDPAYRAHRAKLKRMARARKRNNKKIAASGGYIFEARV